MREKKNNTRNTPLYDSVFLEKQALGIIISLAYCNFKKKRETDKIKGGAKFLEKCGR